MALESKYIWMNGELVEFEKATMHFLTSPCTTAWAFLKAFAVMPPLKARRSFA